MLSGCWQYLSYKSIRMELQMSRRGLPDLVVLRRLHGVEGLLVREGALLPVSLPPGGEGDSPQAEVAGHHGLCTLHLHGAPLMTWDS